MTPAVKRVVDLIRQDRLKEVSRWDVLGNVKAICLNLEELGLLTAYIEDWLYHLRDCAKESL